MIEERKWEREEQKENRRKGKGKGEGVHNGLGNHSTRQLVQQVCAHSKGGGMAMPRERM